MAELLQNSSASTLNGGIDNVVTTLTVTNGAVFPATGNFRIQVCDPVTFANSELMLCTSRAANVLTVTRAVETTAGVAHSTGSLVTHLITVTGLTNFIAEHSISQTIADAKGDIISATAADTMVRKAVGANNTVLMADSTQTDGLLWAGTWTTYTPAWTSTGTAPAVGNGTITGRYLQLGKTVFFSCSLTMGTTSTYGTGQWIFSLPVAVVAGAQKTSSIVLLRDASAGEYQGFDRLATSTTTALFFGGTVAGTIAVAVAATQPFTWASTDVVWISGTYEAA